MKVLREADGGVYSVSRQPVGPVPTWFCDACDTELWQVGYEENWYCCPYCGARL